MNRYIRWGLSLAAVAVRGALGLPNTSDTLFVVGYGSCLPQTPVILESGDGGNTWSYSSLPDGPEKGTFLSASSAISNMTDVAIAAGQGPTGMEPPFIVEKRGLGNWTQIKFPGVDSGVFQYSSCAATGFTDICVATGVFLNGTGLSAVSVNGHWNLMQSQQAISFIISPSCIASGPNIHCFAASYLYDSKTPMILHGENGGNWQTIPSSIDISAISCSQADNINFGCVAVGSGILESTDGVNWDSILIPQGNYLEVVGCVNGTGTCIAGTTLLNGHPLLAYKAKGKWSFQSPAMKETSLYGAYCINDGSEDGYCVMVGYTETYIPFTVTWNGQNSSFSNLTIAGGLTSVSCIPGSSLYCFAGGNTGSGLLIMKTSDGSQWQQASTPATSCGTLFGTTALVFSSKEQNLRPRMGETLELG